MIRNSGVFIESVIFLSLFTSRLPTLSAEKVSIVCLLTLLLKQLHRSHVCLLDKKVISEAFTNELEVIGLWSHLPLVHALFTLNTEDSNGDFCGIQQSHIQLHLKKLEFSGKVHWIYLIQEFHNLSWITEINELFHDILIDWDAPVYAKTLQSYGFASKNVVLSNK